MTANGYASTRYATEIATERLHGEIPARRAGLMTRRYMLSRSTGKQQGSASQPGPPCPEKKKFRTGTQAMLTKTEGRPLSATAIRNGDQIVRSFRSHASIVPISSPRQYDFRAVRLTPGALCGLASSRPEPHVLLAQTNVEVRHG